MSISAKTTKNLSRIKKAAFSRIKKGSFNQTSAKKRFDVMIFWFLRVNFGPEAVRQQTHRITENMENMIFALPNSSVQIQQTLIFSFNQEKIEVSKLLEKKTR